MRSGRRQGCCVCLSVIVRGWFNLNSKWEGKFWAGVFGEKLYLIFSFSHVLKKKEKHSLFVCERACVRGCAADGVERKTHPRVVVG